MGVNVAKIVQESPENKPILEFVGYLLEASILMLDMLLPVIFIRVSGQRDIDEESVLRTKVVKSVQGESVLSQSETGDHAITVAVCERKGTLTLEYILGHVHLKALFVKHLAREFSMENLLFIEAVERYKKQFERQLSKERIRSLCDEIIAEYLKPNSMNEINVPAKDLKVALSEVEALFPEGESVDQQMAQNVFDHLAEHVSGILTTDQLPKFQKSEMYKGIKGMG